MQRFYIGLGEPGHGWAFEHCMVSANRLARRKTDFRVNHWILDSGAFSEVSRRGAAAWSQEVDRYIEQIDRWQVCGWLDAAVSQDLMCEPFMLERTGLSIEAHQARTIERYIALIEWVDETYLMPVLQGYSPSSYAAHVRAYGPLLGAGAWVGVGSLCKRNGSPDSVEDVLLAIRAALAYAAQVEALMAGEAEAAPVQTQFHL